MFYAMPVLAARMIGVLFATSHSTWTLTCQNLYQSTPFAVASPVELRSVLFCCCKHFASMGLTHSADSFARRAWNTPDGYHSCMIDPISERKHLGDNLCYMYAIRRSMKAKVP